MMQRPRTERKTGELVKKGDRGTPANRARKAQLVVLGAKHRYALCPLST